MDTLNYPGAFLQRVNFQIIYFPEALGLFLLIYFKELSM